MKIIVPLFLVFSVAAVCSAGTIDALTNLPSTTNSTLGDNLSTESAAVELTIGTGDVTFDSLTAFFSNFSGASKTIQGGIYADSAGSPGSLIESFTSQTIANGTSSTSFTLVTPATETLSAGTAYWFEFLDPIGSLMWDTAGATGSGTAPTAFSGFSTSGYKVNTGSGWAGSSTNATVDIQVDTASTPEPGAAGLGALSGILLAATGAFRRGRT